MTKWRAAPVRGVLAVAALLLAAAGCRTAGPELHEFVLNGDALGTWYHVKVTARAFDDGAPDEINQIARRELEAVDARMSTYRDDSELEELNRAAGGVPHEVSPELLRVLLAARWVGEATRGTFDITVAPLVDAWGFGPNGRPATIPTDATLAGLRKLTGWKQLEINEADSTVRKATTDVRCDLSGIAKGYAVDRVSEALSAAGWGDHMVEVGGEVRASGVNRLGKPWRIGIERPVAGGGGLMRAVALRDLAMATSGDYRNYFEQDGVRYTHIIDPRTGKPIRHRLASVSVVEEDCMTADGFATGLMVLGENEGYDVAVGNNLAALFLVRKSDGSFGQRATPRFERLFGAAGGTK